MRVCLTCHGGGGGGCLGCSGSPRVGHNAKRFWLRRGLISLARRRARECRFRAAATTMTTAMKVGLAVRARAVETVVGVARKRAHPQARRRVVVRRQPQARAQPVVAAAVVAQAEARAQAEVTPPPCRLRLPPLQGRATVAVAGQKSCCATYKRVGVCAMLHPARRRHLTPQYPANHPLSNPRTRCFEWPARQSIHGLCRE